MWLFNPNYNFDYPSHKRLTFSFAHMCEGPEVFALANAELAYTPAELAVVNAELAYDAAELAIAVGNRPLTSFAKVIVLSAISEAITVPSVIESAVILFNGICLFSVKL